ncbi:MAG: hypothetical protein ACD_28C00147G0007 [uncultured bacterium]|nr:MAG: hypothetical protein ACD_28C00147G0007 [uncultured bacterium]KKT75199.1 MAG: Aminotransferase [Candidatus Peregrinibacteria bacterium GW2011_GWA2_44_7]
MTRFDVLDSIPLKGLFSSSSEISLPSSYAFVSICSAMAFLFRQISLSHRRVIVPAFICPVVLEVMESCNIEPVLVDVNLEDYQISFQALRAMDLSKIGGIWVSHTLGMPTDVEALRHFYKGIIFEDCAHGWGTQSKGRPIGTQGDFSFLSLYKQTPNFSGGLLWSAKHDFQAAYTDCPEATFITGEKWGALMRLSIFPHWPLDFLRRHTPLPPAKDKRSHASFEAIRASNVIKRLFAYGYPTLEKNRSKLREVARWYEALSDNRYFILPQLSHANDRASNFRWHMRLKPDISHLRDPLCFELRRQGIFVDRLWANAPHNNHPHAKLLSQSILNLPIKPEYTQSDVRFLFSTLQSTLQKLL